MHWFSVQQRVNFMKQEAHLIKRLARVHICAINAEWTITIVNVVVTVVCTTHANRAASYFRPMNFFLEAHPEGAFDVTGVQKMRGKSLHAQIASLGTTALYMRAYAPIIAVNVGQGLHRLATFQRTKRLYMRALRPHFCSECEASFALANNLSVHIEAVHEGLRLHHCSECGARSSQASS